MPPPPGTSPTLPGPGRRGLAVPPASNAGLGRLLQVAAPGRALRPTTRPSEAKARAPGLAEQPLRPRREHPAATSWKPGPAAPPASGSRHVPRHVGRADRPPANELGRSFWGGAVCVGAAGPGSPGFGTSASRGPGPGRRCSSSGSFHKHNAVGCVSSRWQETAAALSSFFFKASIHLAPIIGCTCR